MEESEAFLSVNKR